MPFNASSVSTVSSLALSVPSPPQSPSPSSTRSNAGWGSLDIPNNPTSPPHCVEPSVTPSLDPSPILSVDVPLHAHRLRNGTMGVDEKDALHSLLYSPHIHRTLESHLDDNFPLWSITQIYLQNQRLRTLLDLASSPSSIGRRCNILRLIQQTIQDDLFSLFYQLEMPNFATDVERYVNEMTAATNPQTSPSTSSSPLMAAIELAIQRTELGHEVQTTGILHGIPIDAPLPCTHLHYHETCFECHHLGHICANCQWYVCPMCKVN